MCTLEEVEFKTPLAIRIPRTSSHKDMLPRQRREMYSSPFGDRSKCRAGVCRARDQVELPSFFSLSGISHFGSIPCFMHNVDPLHLIFRPRPSDPPTYLEEKERAFSNSIPRLVSDSVDIWKRQAGGDVEYVQGTLDASMRNLGIGC